MRSWRAVTVGTACALVVATTALVEPIAAAPPSTVPGSTPPVPGPVGEASAIQQAVDLSVVDAEFTPLAAPSPVAVGDVLRTDATGYAEVAYLDGSRTRLDVNTEFTVVALVDAAGDASTRTRMGLGRTWHNVESAGQAGEEFAVETSVATATVVGTVFAIQCVAADSCRFVVVEGTIRIELLDGTVIDLVGPASLDVTAGVTTGPTPLAYDAVFSDPWLVDNTERDVTAGFTDRASIFQALGPAFGSMTGTYTGTLTIDGVTCSTFCLGQWVSGAGATFDWSATFSTACTSDTCALVGGAGFPYSFDGTSYRATIETASPCTFDEGGDGVDVETTGRIISVNDITVTPAAAEVRDGSYVVTSIVYGSHITESVEGICNETQTATREEMLALPRYGGMTADQSATGAR